MQKLSILGGVPLSGEVRVAGAKNAALPIMAAALLTGEALRVSNLPELNDVATMTKLLERMGVKAAGAIRTLDQFRALVAAGASRIGTSSGPAILREFR